MRESSLESLLLLATLFVLHEKHGKALTLLEGLYDLAPKDERVLRLLAHSLVVEGSHERALGVVQELLAVSGGTMRGEDMACALRLKASALWHLGRREESRATLDQSVTYLAGPGGTGAGPGGTGAGPMGTAGKKDVASQGKRGGLGW